MRTWILFVCVAFFWREDAFAQNVNIGVLGIFHPSELVLTLGQGQELLISGAGQELFVTEGSDCGALQIRVTGNTLLAKCGKKELCAHEIRATSRNQESANFILTIPGKIRRNYHGAFKVTGKDGVLLPVVAMDIETAVGSVVRAEMTEDAPLEALKAQAVATRSYFIAGGGRHAGFDFCDLTHCQFLREPPPAGSPASRAAAETRGMILTFNGKPIAAMFTRSCGGHTRTPRDIGLPSGEYPYFPVVCDFCYRNPLKWTRKVSTEDAALLSRSGEAGRLAIGRRMGWNAVPSDNFTAREEGGEVALQGFGQGHGVGLCQRGARAMAEDGATFREILGHYFPNTKIEQVSAAIGKDNPRIPI